MRNLLLLILLTLSVRLYSQQDTIVIADYTHLLMQIDQEGLLTPITSLQKVDQGGFFLHRFDEGSIRICNTEPTSIWVNGRLVRLIEGCDFIYPEELKRISSSDTLYMTISSESDLENLICEHVLFEDFKVIRDKVALTREVRNVPREFAICGLVFLTLVVGLFIYGHTSRLAYLLQRTFTLKISAYEFVNTSFFSGASIYLIGFFSLMISFLLLYLDLLFNYGLYESDLILSGLLLTWGSNSLLLFLLLICKWVFISSVAKLFNFRDLNNYQLFDFINFLTVLCMPVTLFILIDFVVNAQSDSWLTSGFILVFPIMLILFILWFILKFVNNSPRRKLMIISYLCATEIVPVIMLLGWFFK